MKPHRDRKGLAVAAVPVVIMALRKPTGTRPTGRNSTVRRRMAAARLKGCRGLPFCIAKAVRIPDPTAPNDHASLRSIWRETMAKEELIQFEGLVTEILPDARYRV